MQSLLEGFDANLEMYGKPNDQKKKKKKQIHIWIYERIQQSGREKNEGSI